MYIDTLYAIEKLQPKRRRESVEADGKNLLLYYSWQECIKNERLDANERTMTQNDLCNTWRIIWFMQKMSWLVNCRLQLGIVRVFIIFIGIAQHRLNTRLVSLKIMCEYQNAYPVIPILYYLYYASTCLTCFKFRYSSFVQQSEVIIFFLT